MKKSSSLVCVAAAALALVGCENDPVSSVDAGMGADALVTSTEDTGVAVDGGGGTGNDAGPLPTGGTCAEPIDVDADGTALAAGVGRRITASNAAAPEGVPSTLADGGCGDPTQPVVLSYTMQTAAYLVATTEDDATTEGLDTVVWILDGCSAAATVLACNDDYGDVNVLSRAASDTILPAGTEVFVVVAGYDGAELPAGTFGLQIREIQPHAANEACDADNYFCVDDHTCLLDEGSETMGHCLADGSDFGLCRTTGTACDGALVCTNATPTEEDPGTCQVPLEGNAACTERHSLCVEGFSCQRDDNSETDRHCRADGTDLGECRSAEPFCDTGLTCSAGTPSADDQGICLVPFAAGAVCTAWRFLCEDGSSCIGDEGSDTMGHCLVDGTEGGICRDTAPECDGTLECAWYGLCEAP